MATSRKAADKTGSKSTLTRGVYRVVLATDEIAFDVQDGTGRERMSARVYDEEEACALKRYWKAEREAGRQRMTRTEWQAMSTARVGHLDAAAPNDTPDQVRRDTPRQFILAEVKLRQRKRKNGGPGQATNGNILIRFFEDHGRADKPFRDNDSDFGDTLPQWLEDENYERVTAVQIIRFAEEMSRRAVKKQVCARAVFEDLEPNRHDKMPAFGRRGRPRATSEPRPWSPAQLVAIARTLRAVYLMAFWILLLAGLRRSEVLGLMNADVDEKRCELVISRQRRGSPRAGTTDPKSTAGSRRLPVARLLMKALVAYRLAMHGQRPDDPVEAAKWDTTFLIVGVKGNAMDGTSLGHAVRDGCDAIGLDFDHLGYNFSPLHMLRKTLGSVLQSGGTGLSGPAISVYLGHGHARTDGLSAAARVTQDAYGLPLVRDLTAIADYVDEWCKAELLPLLGSDDLLAPHGIGEPMALSAAATELGCTEELVMQAVSEGLLTAQQSNFTGPLAGRTVLFDAAAVRALLADRTRAASDTYCTSEVMEILGIGRDGVEALAAAGNIVRLRADTRWRNGHGEGRVLPGGGTRYRKQEVDDLRASFADRSERIRRSLTVAETAELLVCSPDTVRRLVDAGELEAWRDAFVRDRRYIDPRSATAYRATKAAITPIKAAEHTGVPLKQISIWYKTGQLQTRELSAGRGVVMLVLLEQVEQLADRWHERRASATDSRVN